MSKLSRIERQWVLLRQMMRKINYPLGPPSSTLTLIQQRFVNKNCWPSSPGQAIRSKMLSALLRVYQVLRRDVWSKSSTLTASQRPSPARGQTCHSMSRKRYARYSLRLKPKERSLSMRVIKKASQLEKSPSMINDRIRQTRRLNRKLLVCSSTLALSTQKSSSPQ